MLPTYHRITVLNSTGQTMAASAINISYIKKLRRPGELLAPVDQSSVATDTNASTLADGSYWSSTGVSAAHASGVPYYDSVDYYLSMLSAASANGLVQVFLDYSPDGSVWPTNGRGILIWEGRFDAAETIKISFIVDGSTPSVVRVNDINEVRRGRTPGDSLVSVRAVGAITTSSILVHPGAATYNSGPLYGTPATVTVSSADANDTSAGTGARTVRLTGLIAGNVLNTETITMNGQTAVTSVGVYKFIQSLKVLTAGSGGKNAGIIYAGTGTVTSGIPAVELCAVRAGDNVSATGVYGVPNGKVFLPQSITFAVKDDDDWVFTLVTRDATTGLREFLWETRVYVNSASRTAGETFDISHLPAGPAGTLYEIIAVGAAGDTVDARLTGLLTEY